MLDTKFYKEQMDKVNFPVAIQEIPTIPREMAQKIVRTDTEDALGIIKSKYRPINHVDAFDGALQTISKAGVCFDNAELKIDSYENGAMAKMEVMFKDHTAVVGKHNLYLKYIARNSYNGRWKFQSFFGWLNTVCFNTLVSGQKLAYTANKHTKSFDISQSTKKIKSAVEAVTQETDRFNKWWDTKVEDDYVADMFSKTIAKQKLSKGSRLAGVSPINKKQLAVLMGLYNEEVTQIHGRGDYGRNKAKGSLWCAYQSATAWSTHLNDIEKNETKRYLVEQDRQAMVSDMVNSDEWKVLENA